MGSRALESICGAVFDLTKSVALTNTIQYPNETSQGVGNLLSVQEFSPQQNGVIEKNHC